MKQLSTTIIQRLHKAAESGESASQLLRRLNDELPSNERTKLILIRYFRKAFALSLHQASPIVGWSADGEGEISDDALDELLPKMFSGIAANKR